MRTPDGLKEGLTPAQMKEQISDMLQMLPHKDVAELHASISQKVAKEEQTIGYEGMISNVTTDITSKINEIQQAPFDRVLEDLDPETINMLTPEMKILAAEHYFITKLNNIIKHGDTHKALEGLLKVAMPAFYKHLANSDLLEDLLNIDYNINILESFKHRADRVSGDPSVSYGEEGLFAPMKNSTDSLPREIKEQVEGLAHSSIDVSAKFAPKNQNMESIAEEAETREFSDTKLELLDTPVKDYFESLSPDQYNNIDIAQANEAVILARLKAAIKGVFRKDIAEAIVGPESAGKIYRDAANAGVITHEHAEENIKALEIAVQRGMIPHSEVFELYVREFGLKPIGLAGNNKDNGKFSPIEGMEVYRIIESGL